MTQTQKREVYEALSSALGMGVHSMARVFLALHEAGFVPKELGYESDRELLADLPECVKIMDDSEETEILLFSYGETEEKQELQGDDAFPETARPYLDLPLTEWVFFPYRNLGILAQKTGIAQGELTELLCEAYRIAREEKTLTCHEGKLNFPFIEQSVNGGTLLITLKLSEPDREKPWWFSYVYENVRPADYVAPGKLLETFAYMPWPQVLQKLSELALPERWDYGEETGKFSILRSYLIYTYARLHRQNKVCKSKDKTFAAFNTGLVTRNYEDIYACFEPNGENFWRFTDFCVAARRGLGKQLVNLFNPLPQTATYFERKEDLLYDLNRPLLSDYEHIIVENVHRLPLEFLEEQCYNAPDAKALVEELRSCEPEEQESLYNELRQLLSDDDRLYNRIKNRVEDAIELARKMVRWNFKTALPSYFPTANTMSLMLPLFLCSEERVDNVLVVELTESGNYQGQTILTPKQAYLDARLVCRPDSDWLTPISMDPDEN